MAAAPYCYQDYQGSSVGYYNCVAMDLSVDCQYHLNWTTMVLHMVTNNQNIINNRI